MSKKDPIVNLIEEFLEDKRENEEDKLFEKDIDGKDFPRNRNTNDSQKLSEDYIKYGKVYNEFSLQHELGEFLKMKFKNDLNYSEFKDFKVQYERNVEDFFDGRNLNKDEKFIKSEMDIVIFKNFKRDSKKYAIELKFPANKTPSKRMPHFLEDVIFMENVKDELKFTRTYCLTLVPNNKNGEAFRKGQPNDKEHKFYKYFRGDICKDTVQAIAPINSGYTTEKYLSKLKKTIPFSITREYEPIKWEYKTDYCFYYLLPIPDSVKG